MKFTELPTKQKTVEKALRKYFNPPYICYSEHSKTMFEAMRYSLFAGGKRFRPTLLLLAYEAISEDFEKALPSACAVEYIHTYSLIHDDLPAIDDDDLRRGMPSCHKKYGEDIAILAGDALFSEAFVLISKYQESDAEIIKKAIAELSVAAGASGMVGGQVADVCKNEDSITEDELYFIHTHKTGKLIVAAAKIGAMLAGANENQLARIENYAINLGLAFQIKDDVLDEEGDTHLLGKNAGSDQRKNKATYVSMYGLLGATKKAIEKSEAAISSTENEKLRTLAKYVVSRSN